MSSGAVPIGPGTVVGFGAPFIAAVVAVILGDRSEEQVTIVVGGLILALTIAGRQWQAGQTVKATAAVEAAHAQAAVSATSIMSPVLEGVPSDPNLEVQGGGVPA
jgi:hypothetical protein